MVRIVLGIVGILIAVVVLVAGLLALQADTTLGGLDPAARLSAPGSVRFDAEERDYTIAFNRRRTDSLVASTRCTITHPNESVSRVRGDRQAVSIEGETIGEFEGRGGPTRVECTFVNLTIHNTGARLVVVAQREWLRTLGFVLIGGGIFGLLVSIALLLFGIRARNRPARPISPLGPPAG